MSYPLLAGLEHSMHAPKMDVQQTRPASRPLRAGLQKSTHPSSRDILQAPEKPSPVPSATKPNEAEKPSLISSTPQPKEPERPDHPPCAICQEDFRPTSTIAQPSCHPTHIYHHDCFMEWLNTSLDMHTSCPSCRKEIKLAYIGHFDARTGLMRQGVREVRCYDVSIETLELFTDDEAMQTLRVVPEEMGLKGGDRMRDMAGEWDGILGDGPYYMYAEPGDRSPEVGDEWEGRQIVVVEEVGVEIRRERRWTETLVSRKPVRRSGPAGKRGRV